MLDALRKASEGWMGRLLMAVVLGFIVVSFVIWGIGDIFRGFGSDTLATVGGRTITTQEFRTAYERELNQLQQQQRRPITTQEAQAMGLDSQVLSTLIANAVLDNQAKDLGLALSDAEVADFIRKDPSLKGPGGTFDAAAFANILQQNGLTEAQFIQQQKELDLRREVADAIIGGAPVPRPMLEAVDQFRNETRSVDVFDLPVAAVGPIPKPSDKDLQTYFDARRAQWKAPEYRALTVLAITPASVADPSKITDAQARAYYDANKQSYGAPEKRQILQVTFQSQADAQAAAAKIKAGADFAAAAKDAKAPVVDLGLVEKSALFDPAIAKAAFSLPQEGAVSAPVKGEFGWVLLKAAKIEAATVKPFSEAEPSIKAALASQQAEGAIAKLRDRIEDQRTSGKTLTQAAASVGLKTQFVPAVTAEGVDKSGKPVALPDKSDLLKAAFASDVGLDNDYLTARDGSVVWFEVAKVDPAHDRTLAEVKPQVEAEWTQDQTDRRLAEKAREIVKKIDGGATIASVAKSYGASIRTINDLKRIGSKDAPAPLVAQVFNVPLHAAGSAATAPKTRLVFWVNDSETPPFDPSSKINQELASTLRSQISDDVLDQFLDALQARYGVKVDRAALSSAVASGAQAP